MTRRLAAWVSLLSAGAVALASCAIPNDFEKVELAAGGGGAATACGDRPPDPPSCPGDDAEVDDNCGPGNADWCCDFGCVPGGEFHRSFDGDPPFDTQQWPAYVGPFWLDYYEVTIGRFRTFMAEVENGWRPAAGQGAHPMVPDTGWEADYESELWVSEADVTSRLLDTNNVECGDLAYVNWTEVPEDPRTETMPMNCVPWFMAMAFCIWDGGRLPSEAEWNFAAAGGDEQNRYPWGDMPLPVDDSLVVIGCDPVAGCMGNDPMEPPGSRENVGAALWGHADMAGNVFEWTLDRRILSNPDHTPLADNLVYEPETCNECVDTSQDGDDNTDNHRVVRGGAWFVNSMDDDIPDALRVSQRGSIAGAQADYGAGIRCARDLQ